MLECLRLARNSKKSLITNLYLLTIVLFLAVGLTACGNSGSAAATATNSATPSQNQIPEATPIESDLPWVPYKPGTKITLPDLSSQGQAMLPAFKTDIELGQNKTAPVYNIALRLKQNGDSYAGEASEQIFYTNDTGETLHHLFLWLWANAPTDPGYTRPLSVAAIRLNGKPAAWNYANNGAQLDISLDSLPAGEKAVIELDFNLQFPKTNQYEYFKYDPTSHILSLTFWYPQLAVFYADKKEWDTHPFNTQGDITNSRVSFFNFWLTAPSQMVPVVNGKTLETHENQDGTRRYHIVTGPVRDLVASLCTGYQISKVKVGDTEITSYFLESDKTWGEQAAAIASKALISYNYLFGKYPYGEFKIAESNLVNFGGFEFPGMILITKSYYNDSSALSLEYAIAHETAHQWWYGLVGSDQILHPWQDEGLTQYSPIFYYERFKDENEAHRVLNTYMQNGFQAMVDSGKDEVADQPVYAWQNFTGYLWAVYNKAGLFYDAYRTRFGDPAFSRFGKTYLENNRYKFAGENDILDALKTGAGPGNEQAVEDLFVHWIKSKEDK